MRDTRCQDLRVRAPQGVGRRTDGARGPRVMLGSPREQASWSRVAWLGSSALALGLAGVRVGVLGVRGCNVARPPHPTPCPGPLSPAFNLCPPAPQWPLSLAPSWSPLFLSRLPALGHLLWTDGVPIGLGCAGFMTPD